MKVDKTNLEVVLKITLEVFDNHSDYCIETYNGDLYKKNDIKVKLIYDDIALS